MKLPIAVLVVLTVLTGCGRSDSGPTRGADVEKSGATNQPGKTFTAKDGKTVRIGTVTIDGTNVPATNIQVR